MVFENLVKKIDESDYTLEQKHKLLDVVAEIVDHYEDIGKTAKKELDAKNMRELFRRLSE